MMLEGYADSHQHPVEPVIPSPMLKKIMAATNQLGANTLCHCYGDGAVRAYLDAVEATADSNTGVRHIISHAMYIDDADLFRIAKDNVTIQFSAQWATPEQTKFPFICL